MKSRIMRKSFAAVSAAALVATLAVTVVPSASATPVCATTAGVETCQGKLANGSSYVFRMPANFKGTMFFWEHGFKATYPYPGYTPPTGVVELTPGNSVTSEDVTKEMLRAGYGIAAYDGTDKGARGWNTAARVEMLKEVIDIAVVKFPTIQKKVVYGSSQAGSIITPFAEKYPTYADSIGIMAGLTPSAADSIQSACDAMYLFSIFADPTIKGCAAFGVKGPAGHVAALTELGKVVNLLKVWSTNYGAPALEYPAALKPAGIPQRSALLLTGLLIGIPTKSAHMDGITTGGLVPEQSINATVAVLENMGDAIATGVLAGQSISEITGPGMYDNTKTNYSALLDEGDAGRYNLGLSGDDGINAMLATIAAAPRVTGDPAAIAKLKALDASKFTSTVPTILLSNEADRLVFPGNSSRYVDRKRAVYEAALEKWEADLAAATTLAAKTAVRAKKPRWNTLAIWAITPETYTKYTAAGAPDLTAPVAVSGTGHQTFTKAQTMAWVNMLALAARSGKVPTAAYVEHIAKYVPYLSDDADYRPADLKYDFTK
jgi:hypothetical protein